MEIFDEFMVCEPDEIVEHTHCQDMLEFQSWETTPHHPVDFVVRSASSSRPSENEAHTTTGGHDLESMMPTEHSSTVEHVFCSTGNSANEHQVQTSTPPVGSRHGIWSERRLWRPVVPRPSIQNTTLSSTSVATQDGVPVGLSRRKKSSSRKRVANNTRPSANLTCQTCGLKKRTPSELRYEGLWRMGSCWHGSR